MIRALLYLRFASLINRVLVSVRRLRQPNYLIGALAGAAYFYYLVFGRLHASFSKLPRSIFSTQSQLASVFSGALLDIGAAAVLILVVGREALVWNTPPAEAGLRFTEAEIAFLFPAPLSRRRLVHFSLIKNQTLILVSALFLSVFFSPHAGFVRASLLHAVGWWVILSTLNFHSIAASLTVVRLRQTRTDFSRLRRIVLGLIAALVAVAALSFYRAVRRSGPDADMFSFLDQALHRGILRVILIPFAWVVAPFLASNFHAFLLALPPALALLAALYIWIVRLEVPFEEGSIAQAEKRTQTRSGRRLDGSAGRTAPQHALREPFRLAPAGRPETAFLWKNLFAIQSWFSLRFFVSVIAFITALLWSTAGRHRDSSDHAGHYATLALIGAAMLAFYTLLVGPQLLRQDLRGDLANADMLKTYPLAGWQVVLGEMLTPLAILCGLLWFSLLVASWALTQLAPAFEGFSPGLCLVLTLCAASVVPPVCILQLIVPNGAALLFPAWFQASRARGGGVEVVGQRLIFAGGQLLAVVGALLPAALTALLLIFASQWLIGLGAAAVLATLAILAIVGAEVACGLWWLGRRFEKLDLSTLDT